MAINVNISSQIVVQTAAQWAADATVYSAKRILVTSDAFYGSSDQRKFKIADGVQTWANLDYFLDSLNYLQLQEQGSIGTPPANEMRFTATDESGRTVVSFSDSTGFQGRIMRDNIIIARNTSGSAMTKGQAVYVSGATGSTPNIALAQSNDLNTLDPTFLVAESIANNAYGYVIRVGILENFDTSAYIVGTRLYVSPTVAGALTSTRPSSPNFAEFVATVLVSGVGNGAILVDVETPTASGGEIWQESGGVITPQTLANILRLGTASTNWGVSPLEIYSEIGQFPLFIGDAGGADGLLYIEHVAGAFNVTSTIDLDFTSSLIKVLTQVAGANNNDAASTEYVDRVNAQSVVSAATVTPVTANDVVVITAQAVGLTLANPTGTWQQGQALTVRIKDDGTSRTIAYGAGYRAIGTTLPTATTAGKTIYLFIIYNSTDSRWDVTGVSEEA